MIIEVLPCFGSEHLYAGIECGSRCHAYGKQGGVERVDIVEMHHLCLLLAYVEEQIADGYHADDYQRDEQMNI